MIGSRFFQFWFRQSPAPAYAIRLARTDLNHRRLAPRRSQRPATPFIHRLNGKAGREDGRFGKRGAGAEKARAAPDVTTDQTERAAGQITRVRKEFVDCTCKVAQLRGQFKSRLSAGLDLKARRVR